jgi:hypothetical protein
MLYFQPRAFTLILIVVFLAHGVTNDYGLLTDISKKLNKCKQQR